jgi:hypothetical protein
MLRLVLLFLLLFSFMHHSKACDVCGCASGSINLGILPQFHKHFIGLNYSSRSFNSYHTVLNSDESAASRESFNTLELRSRINLAKRVHFFAFLPFMFNKQEEENSTTTISGLGDFTGIVNYSLLLTPDSLSKQVKHNLQIGGGIKLPIGRYTVLDHQLMLNPNIQTGTGSFDFVCDAFYTLRIKKFGLSTSAFYRLNTANKNNFRFGDRLSLTSNFFYWKQYKANSILPGIGVMYESTGVDYHKKLRLSQSGGQSLFAGCNVDIYLRNYSFSFSGQLPLHQTNALTKESPRFNCSFFYNF